MPSSVISSQSMHLGVLATASHALMTKTLFVVYSKPRFGHWFHFVCNLRFFNYFEILLFWSLFPFSLRTSQFIVCLNKYLEAINNKFSLGMRFRMRFEGEESPERRFSASVMDFWSLSSLNTQLDRKFLHILIAQVHRHNS